MEKSTPTTSLKNREKCWFIYLQDINLTRFTSIERERERKRERDHPCKAVIIQNNKLFMKLNIN
jgi:hypothetical protein